MTEQAGVEARSSSSRDVNFRVAAAVHAVRPALDAEVEHRVEAEDRLAERVKCSLAELGQRVLILFSLIGQRSINVST